MKQIQLSGGGVALVDDEDFEMLSRYRWKRYLHGYACRSQRIRGKHVCILMHRVVARAPDGLHVDHIDLDKLNNTRANLRVVDRAANERNKPPTRRNKSGVKGVLRWLTSVCIVLGVSGARSAATRSERP